MTGKIIKGIAGFYYVCGEDGIVYECKAKGIFRKDNQKPLVGDNVGDPYFKPAGKRRESCEKYCRDRIRFFVLRLRMWIRRL